MTEQRVAQGCICRALGLGDRGMVSLVGAGGKTSLLYRLARELTMDGRRVLVTTTTHMMRPQPEEAVTTLLSPDPGEILEELRGLPASLGPALAASHQEVQGEKLVGFSPEGVESIWRPGLLDWILVEADGASRRPLKAPASHEPVVPVSSGWVVGLVGLDAVGKPLDEPWVFRWEIFGRLSGLTRGQEVTPESVARLALHPEGLFRGAPEGALRVLWLNKADMPGAVSAARRIVSFIASEGWGNIGRAVVGSTRGPEPAMACFGPPGA
jgi:probable selenium-dependent hydroxylase accessory protein YqeC